MRRWLKHHESRGASPTGSEVSIPESLLRQIQELVIKRPELGYIDMDEFIRDATRRFIREL